LSNVFVLGTDGNLWLEPVNWQQNGQRTLVDVNAQSFAVDPREPGYVYVEGTDGNLWLEDAGWEEHGRTFVDSNVKSFVVDPREPNGYVYVEGTDGNLWLEAPGWNQPGKGRFWIDSNVQSFAPDPSANDDVYVLETAGDLWLEGAGWNLTGHSRTLIAGEVLSFAPNPNALGDVWVEGNNQTLWLEAPGQKSTLTYVDSNVLDFAVDPQLSDALYVEGTDGNLWLEGPGWQQSAQGRTPIDEHVHAYAADPQDPGHLFVEGTDDNLWIEVPGWQQNHVPRTLVDGSVQAFASDPAVLTGFTLYQSQASPVWGPGQSLISETSAFEDVIEQTWTNIAENQEEIHGQTLQQYIYSQVQQDAEKDKVTARHISDTVGTQGSYSAALDTSSTDPTLHIDYYIGGNTLTFTTTNDTSAGSYADPTFHVTFDLSIDVSMTLPSSLSPQSTVAVNATAMVVNVYAHSSNVFVSSSQVQEVANAIAGNTVDLSSLVDTGLLNAGLQGQAKEGHTFLSASLDNSDNLVLWTQPAKFMFPGPIGVEYATTAHETDCCGRDVQTILGLPIGNNEDVPAVPGAYMQTFQGGTIYYSQATGAHVVYGKIGAEYAATAGKTDFYGNNVQELLGLPTGDEKNVPGVPGARMQTFQGGTIYWSSATGAHVAYGGIGAKYNSLGGPTSLLGLPTSDEQEDGDDRIQYFDHGFILWLSDGQTIVYW
jgi:hypothetical protein